MNHRCIQTAHDTFVVIAYVGGNAGNVVAPSPTVAPLFAFKLKVKAPTPHSKVIRGIRVPQTASERERPRFVKVRQRERVSD